MTSTSASNVLSKNTFVLDWVRESALGVSGCVQESHIHMALSLLSNGHILSCDCVIRCWRLNTKTTHKPGLNN